MKPLLSVVLVTALLTGSAAAAQPAYPHPGGARAE